MIASIVTFTITLIITFTIAIGSIFVTNLLLIRYQFATNLLKKNVVVTSLYLFIVSVYEGYGIGMLVSFLV